MKNIVLAILMSVFVAAPAVAADTGFYIGLKAGTAKKKVDPVSESSSAWGLFGGLKFNQNFAVEAGYTDLGDVSGLLDFTAIDVSAVGIFPISEQSALYGKLGMARTKEELSLLSLSETRSAVTFGVGGQFDFNPNIGIRLGYDRYKFGDAIFAQGDIDLWSVAGVFSF